MQEIKQLFSPIKENILKYLEYKGVSKYYFYKHSGVTRGILDQKNGISEENIYLFLRFASDINPTWLITGRGAMLLDGAEPAAVAPVAAPRAGAITPGVCAVCAEKEKRIEVLEQLVQSLERMIGHIENTPTRGDSSKRQAG